MTTSRWPGCGRRQASVAQTAALAALVLFAASASVMAAAPATPVTAAMPAYDIAHDATTDGRRTVGVRLERRLDDATLVRIATAVHARSAPGVSRARVTFLLPGQAVADPWATVVLSPEPRVTIHGLSVADVDALTAEHRADQRTMVGSWLTSPPAPPARLTIYRSGGRLLAEWRLRNGQRTVDDVQETSSDAGRRYVVAGGGSFLVVRSGELQIWDGTTRIATAERIRAEPPSAPPAAVAAAGPAAIAPRGTDTAPSAGPQRSPVPTGAPEPTGPRVPSAGAEPATTPPTEALKINTAEVAETPAEAPVVRPPHRAQKVRRKAEPRRPVATAATASAPGTRRQFANGDTISRTLSGQF